MPEGDAPRWSAAQQAMLREMGYELFSQRIATVRGELVESHDSRLGAPPALPPEAPRGIRQARPERVGQGGARLVLLANGDALLRGPHAALVRSLLRALRVQESDIRGEPHEGIPAIAFGHDAPGALRAPGLAELRTGRAKRALWPTLRALKKRLAR